MSDQALYDALTSSSDDSVAIYVLTFGNTDAQASWRQYELTRWMHEADYQNTLELTSMNEIGGLRRGMSNRTQEARDKALRILCEMDGSS